VRKVSRSGCSISKMGRLECCMGVWEFNISAEEG
jgi:hypothetical protein